MPYRRTRSSVHNRGSQKRAITSINYRRRTRGRVERYKFFRIVLRLRLAATILDRIFALFLPLLFLLEFSFGCSPDDRESHEQRDATRLAANDKERVAS